MAERQEPEPAGQPARKVTIATGPRIRTPARVRWELDCHRAQVSLVEQRVLVSVTGTKDLGRWQRWRARVGVTAGTGRGSALLGGDTFSFPGGDNRDDASPYFEMPRQLARDIVAGLPGVVARVTGMNDLVQRIARDLERVMVPRGLQAARAFCEPGTWWFVYAVASDDSSGRLTQLAEVCPGLLLMALGLRREHSVEVSQQIIEGAVKGQRLTRLLEKAARSWLHEHLVRLEWCDLPGPSADECERLASCQRIRIRRASARVPLGLLLAPPPPAMIPADIPSSPEHNRCWYIRLMEDMDHWVVELGRSHGLPPDLPLQTHGLIEWRGPAGTIRPLTTVEELVVESRNMHHCVASMAQRGIDGCAVFLHGELLGAPVTLEVRPDAKAGGFHLAEAKGEHNRPLETVELELVRRWLRSINRDSS